MQHSRKERRGIPGVERKTFGELVRVAIRRRVPDARSSVATWTTAPNLGWARWAREEGRYAYCGMRRRHDGITGELGVSLTAVDLDQVPLVHSLTSPPAEGCRVQLGTLLNGQEQWWSSGGSEKTLIERIDWIAVQLQLRMLAFLSSTSASRQP